MTEILQILLWLKGKITKTSCGRCSDGHQNFKRYPPFLPVLPVSAHLARFTDSVQVSEVFLHIRVDQLIATGVTSIYTLMSTLTVYRTLF